MQHRELDLVGRRVRELVARKDAQVAVLTRRLATLEAWVAQQQEFLSLDLGHSLPPEGPRSPAATQDATDAPDPLHLPPDPVPAPLLPDTAGLRPPTSPTATSPR